MAHSSQARSAIGNGKRSSASTVWPPSLAAQAAASAFRQRQHQPHSRSRSFVTALKGFMPARLRLAARGRSRRLLAPSPLASFRCPPRCGVVMQTCGSLRHGAPERRRPTLADSLPPAPAEPARLPQTSSGSRAG
ncbi:hypothetical protein EXT67_18195 [Pectobacterium atrosepticum]|nr:hypothetical protein [Pectobacterium atrosepticum]MCL6318236.1 hypothetical protein [Pectobacterium atrosepticum]MCL6322615.1 hypothetical protein [Pectobacterium atrosepticum]MCL6322622.1 hypothetical protein [Pectobacterium atrosepticum]MCL6392633.1 hypothetical protein [Pectobacterium atrosepticum]